MEGRERERRVEEGREGGRERSGKGGWDKDGGATNRERGRAIGKGVGPEV